MFGRFWIILITSLLAACSSLDQNLIIETKSTGKPPVELRLWLWTGTGLEPLIKEYDEMHPEIDIILETYEYEDVHKKLQNTFAVNEGAPDISLIEASFLEQFKRYEQYFINLRELDADELEPLYYSWKWKQATNANGDFIFGLPTDIGPIAMLYRPDIFKKAGLPSERDEVAQIMNNWDEFVKAGVRIKERAGIPMLDNTITLYRVLLSQSGQTYFDDKTKQLTVAERPEIKQAWDFAVKASRMGLSAHKKTALHDWSTGMDQGDFAVILTPAWMINQIKMVAPQAAGKWDLTYLPGKGVNWGGSFLTIPKGSQHITEAYDVIRWLTDSDRQLQVFNQNGNFPSVKTEEMKSVIIHHRDPFVSDAPIGHIYLKAAEQIVSGNEGLYHHTINSIIEEQLWRVELNESGGDEAWKEALALIEKNIKPLLR